MDWWFKQKKFISHSSGDWQVSDQGWLGSDEDSLPGLQKATFLVCPHIVDRGEERAVFSEGH